MLKDILLWLTGLVVVSLVGGHFTTRLFVDQLNKKVRTQDVDGPWDKVPDWLRKRTVGLVERLFFTTIIAADLSGAPVAMIAWISVKGYFYWSTFEGKYPTQVLIAVLGSLVSLWWAMVGGFICNGRLWHWCASTTGAW